MNEETIQRAKDTLEMLNKIQSLQKQVELLETEVKNILKYKGIFPAYLASARATLAKLKELRGE